MSHTLTSQDQWFLDMHRRDPLTGSTFAAGDRVVVCLKCRCVQSAEAWEFNGGACCTGSCGSRECTSDFSREFIDFSYHHEEPSGKTSGFRVVETDTAYKNDLLRRLFTLPQLRRLWHTAIALNLAILALGLGLLVWEDARITALTEPLQELAAVAEEGVTELGQQLEKLSSLPPDADAYTERTDAVTAKLAGAADKVAARADALTLPDIPAKLAAIDLDAVIGEKLAAIHDFFEGGLP